MRLKEDNSSWKSRGIVRRDFRHTHGEPEVPKGHPKNKKRATRKPKKTCKHVWVQVDYSEWVRYHDKSRSLWAWSFMHDDPHKPYWADYSTYFVCAGCLETKRKTDVGKQRQHYRKAYGRSW